MTDTWLLEELVGKIKQAETTKEQAPVQSPPKRPKYVGVLVAALDEALRVLGRNGSEVVDTLLVQRFGLCKDDIALNPGAYMSALKDVFDNSIHVIEVVILEEVRKETGIVAMTVEEAVPRLKRYYREQPDSRWEIAFGPEFDKIGEGHA